MDNVNVVLNMTKCAFYMLNVKGVLNLWCLWHQLGGGYVLTINWFEYCSAWASVGGVAWIKDNIIHRFSLVGACIEKGLLVGVVVCKSCLCMSHFSAFIICVLSLLIVLFVYMPKRWIHTLVWLRLHIC